MSSEPVEGESPSSVVTELGVSVDGVHVDRRASSGVAVQIHSEDDRTKFAVMAAGANECLRRDDVVRPLTSKLAALERRDKSGNVLLLQLEVSDEASRAAAIVAHG